MQTMGGSPEEQQATGEQAEDLEPMRAAVTASERGVAPADALFEAMQAQLKREERSVLGGLRSQSTTTRRLIVIGVLAVIAAIELWLRARDAFDVAPLRVGISLAVFGVLMTTAALSSVRPLHLPALSRARELSLLAGPLAIALGLSLWPTSHAHEPLAETFRGAAPCFVYGSLVAIPVFLIARVLDRGAWLTGIAAALAAGLFANFVLMTHCPLAGSDHMLLGHFGVLFAGLAAFSLWTRLRANA